METKYSIKIISSYTWGQPLNYFNIMHSAKIQTHNGKIQTHNGKIQIRKSKIQM